MVLIHITHPILVVITILFLAINNSYQALTIDKDVASQSEIQPYDLDKPIDLRTAVNILGDHFANGLRGSAGEELEGHYSHSEVLAHFLQLLNDPKIHKDQEMIGIIEKIKSSLEFEGLGSFSKRCEWISKNI